MKFAGPAYKGGSSFLEHSKHLMSALDTCLRCSVIARPLHTVLSDHVHHLEVSGEDRLVVFEQLRILLVEP
jgi:hypothetical protein